MYLQLKKMENNFKAALSKHDIDMDSKWEEVKEYFHDSSDLSFTSFLPRYVGLNFLCHLIKCTQMVGH